MRRQIAGIVLAGACALAAGCTASIDGKAVAADKTGLAAQVALPVSALDRLLLGVGPINSALGATSMKVWFSATKMWNWTADVTDKNCQAVDGPAQENVYANTGWTAMRGQRLDDSLDG